MKFDYRYVKIYRLADFFVHTVSINFNTLRFLAKNTMYLAAQQNDLFLEASEKTSSKANIDITNFRRV